MLLPDVLRLFACGWRLPNATEGCYLPCLPTSMACAKGCRQHVDVAHVEVNVRPTVITLAIISAAFSPFASRRRCYDEYRTYVQRPRRSSEDGTMGGYIVHHIFEPGLPIGPLLGQSPNPVDMSGLHNLALAADVYLCTSTRIATDTRLLLPSQSTPTYSRNPPTCQNCTDAQGTV